MTKAKKVPTKKTYYLVDHPIYGKKRIYSNWVELCEDTLDLAQGEVEKTLEATFKESVCALADEMIETAEEYEPMDEEMQGLG